MRHTLHPAHLGTTCRAVRRVPFLHREQLWRLLHLVLPLGPHPGGHVVPHFCLLPERAQRIDSTLSTPLSAPHHHSKMTQSDRWAWVSCEAFGYFYILGITLQPTIISACEGLFDDNWRIRPAVSSTMVLVGDLLFLPRLLGQGPEEGEPAETYVLTSTAPALALLLPSIVMLNEASLSLSPAPLPPSMTVQSSAAAWMPMSRPISCRDCTCCAAIPTLLCVSRR